MNDVDLSILQPKPNDIVVLSYSENVSCRELIDHYKKIDVIAKEVGAYTMAIPDTVSLCCMNKSQLLEVMNEIEKIVMTLKEDGYDN